MTIQINQDLSENIEYNNKRFPAYIKRKTLSHYLNYKASCHWHTDFEFIYIYDGTMKYDINGTVITLSAKQGLFVNSNCLHFGFSDSRTECHFLCILLHPDLLSSNTYFNDTILAPLQTNSKLPFIKLLPSCEWQNEIILSLLRINDVVGNKNEALDIIQSFVTILHFIIENIGNASHIRQNDHDLSSLTAMIGYVQHNYIDKISVDTLCTVGKCCKTKCNNLFKKYLHTTPVMYVTGYRLEKSIDLLLHTALSISEIAYACGFSSTSYFCETFHKQFGITPNQYRKQVT